MGAWLTSIFSPYPRENFNTDLPPNGTRFILNLNVINRTGQNRNGTKRMNYSSTSHLNLAGTNPLGTKRLPFPILSAVVSSMPVYKGSLILDKLPRSACREH